VFGSISIARLAEKAPFVYVNIESGLLAMYAANIRLDSLRRGIKREIWRGAGGSNADTCGVQIAWPTSLPNLNSPAEDAVRLLEAL
jgi:hypothetical protein